MPFNRPTLSELREQNQGFLETQLKDTGKLLRFSNMRVLSDIVSGMAHLHYGYLDYIALQATPATATDEHLAAWGALKSIFRKAAAAAQGKISLTGGEGAYVEAGAILKRSDGYQYRLNQRVTLGADGQGEGHVTAILFDPQEDATGGGANGNAGVGTILTLDTPWLNVDSRATLIEAAAGGADIETEDSFRSRILFAYQNPPQGGNEADFVRWALEVPAVTRAWVVRRLMGAGTVGVYIMSDEDGDGFPDGTDGVSSKEDWGAVKATGLQGKVADYIYDLQPVTSLTYVCSPIKKEIDIEIEGLSGASDVVRNNIREVVAESLFDVDRLDGKSVILLSDLNFAISSVAGTSGYILKEPHANIALDVGELPVVGEITYAG